MRVLHAADFHLDSPFRGLSPEKARQRRQESRELLTRLAGLAVQRQAELVLLSGDLFDSAQVYRETLEQLAAALGQIPCPVFIAPGNHDPYCAGSPYLGGFWPRNVHIFSAAAIEAVELESCTVYGGAFTGPEQTESLLSGFRAPAEGRLSLMCLHANMAGGGYNPITREEIGQSGLTYLALGHIHQCSGLQREGETFYAYPGCPEGRGFDELGEKGVLFGTVAPGRVEMEFLPLCRRRYEIEEADITGREVREAVEEALSRGDEGDILRLVLTGESDTAPDLSALQAVYGSRRFDLSLRDQTRLGEDLWGRAGEDSLRGLFLARLRRQYDGTDSDEEWQKITAAVRLGLGALDRRDL